MKLSLHVLSRRAAVIGTVAILSAASSTITLAQPSDAARREGKATVYTDQPTEMLDKLTTLFKSKNPGMDVEFFRGDTTQVTQRFDTETAAGRHYADMLTSTVRRSRLFPENAMQPYKSPATANYPADLNPANNRWAVYAVTLTSFAWNTRLVPAGQEPKTWEDLLDAKWRGKIGMQDPLQGGGVASWIATMYAAWGEAKWTDYMKKLAAQQPRYGRYLQVQEMLGSGEISVMAAAYPDYIESSMKSKGAPVEWGAPNPVVRTGLSLNLSANAPRPNAGKLFFDFLLSADAQKIQAEAGRLPALEAQWPPVFAKLKSTSFIDSADELEAQRADFFRAKIQEFFGNR